MADTAPRYDPEVNPPQLHEKQLIITSGDISDVDGFLAVAEYAKTGADALFVMNYPAYIGVDWGKFETNDVCERDSPGLGYVYSSDQVLRAVPSPAPEKYTSFMKKYASLPESNELVKRAMTDMAHCIVNKVWDEAKGSSGGKIYFQVGGINKINPFSSNAVKNEMVVFAESALEGSLSLDATEGAVFDAKGAKTGMKLDTYDEIYIDFNGSMAFFSDNSQIYQDLVSLVSKIKGAFIMGGIDADAAPKTMPSIAGVLNRFSSATMNQLYHPENTARFFSFLDQHKIPTFTVTNNAVHDLSTFAEGNDGAPGPKTYDGVQRYLYEQQLRGPFLASLARAYYENPHGQPPRKAFDHYVAVALARFVHFGVSELLNKVPDAVRKDRNLFFSDKYGVTIVSSAKNWPAALVAFKSHLDTTPQAGDTPFVVAKKASLVKEVALMEGLGNLPSLEVHDLSFDLHPKTRRLSLPQLDPATTDDPAAATVAAAGAGSECTDAAAGAGSQCADTAAGAGSFCTCQ